MGVAGIQRSQYDVGHAILSTELISMMRTNDKNFRTWLEQNRLYRRLYVLRKLYLSRTRARHYAQFAEDVSIERLVRHIDNGFFVDVGCFHPSKHNNTYALYRKGWRGINIDIDSIKIDAFNILRPKDINIACAVGESDGVVEFYSRGLFALTTTMDENFAKSKGHYTKQIVACRRLSTIIDESKYSNQQIDFLSIDAEGFDFQVLKSLDLARYRPKLIAVESHLRVFAQIAKSDLFRYLSEHGYDLVGWVGLTLLLASAELQRDLKPA